MIRQKTPYRLATFGILAFVALTFAIRQDWISVGLCLFIAAVVAVRIVGAKRKADAEKP
jgi:hypothetical protein